MNSNLSNLTNSTTYYSNHFTTQQGATLDSDYTWAIKQGKIVHLMLRFTTGQYKDVNIRMIQMPEALKPARSSYPVISETWGTTTAQVCLNAEGCNIWPTNSTKTSTDYFLDCTYIAAN